MLEGFVNLLDGNPELRSRLLAVHPRGKGGAFTEFETEVLDAAGTVCMRITTGLFQRGPAFLKQQALLGVHIAGLGARYVKETGIELVEDLRHLSPKGLPLAQFALRWLLDHPEVSTIIAGVTKASQLEANVAATKVDPLEPALHEELRDWYERKVRDKIRGRI